MNLTFKIFFCFVTFSVASLNAASTADSKVIQVINDGSSNLIVQAGERSARIALSHSVDGYEVDCGRNWMAAWGKPRKMNPDNPQDSTLTMIDLQALKASRVIGFSKGIFAVEYLQRRPGMLVYTDGIKLIDFVAGTQMQAAANREFTPKDFPRQSCDDFKFKSYHRYKE